MEASGGGSFFVKGFSVKSVADILKKSRETISRHITKCEGYEAEMRRRKDKAAQLRREYQRDWVSAKRLGLKDELSYEVTEETMKREQAIAARILSGERFCSD